jgi:hypothetical protein
MLALAVVLLAAAPNNVELEFGGGFAHSLESSPDASGGYPFAAPALQSRVAVDFSDLLSVGATFLAIVGGEAPNGVSSSPPFPGQSEGLRAFTATALLFSLRIHSSGSPQLWAEGGLGVGHLISLQTENSFEHAPLRGHAGLSTRLAAGLRWPVSNRVLLGGELGLTSWSNVESGPTGYNGTPLSGLSTFAAMLLFSVTYSVFER